jgi:uracil-DNA glycosylase
MVVGEAPGRSEDIEGQPFVGAAGRVLNHALKLAGLQRDKVFITNVAKCRPPKNRKPFLTEAETCAELYLLREVRKVVPRAILAVGALALETLFPDESQSISEVRGVPASCERLSYLTVVPTWHPAYVLYQGGPSSNVGKQFRDDVKVWAKYGT